MLIEPQIAWSPYLFPALYVNGLRATERLMSCVKMMFGKVMTWRSKVAIAHSSMMLIVKEPLNSEEHTSPVGPDKQLST